MGREIDYQPPQRRLVPWSRVTEILEKHRLRIEEHQRMLSWEIHLEKRIRAAGFKCAAFDGITDHAGRKEYFRSIIRMHSLADKPCGKSTFGGAFLMIYREDL